MTIFYRHKFQLSRHVGAYRIITFRLAFARNCDKSNHKLLRCTRYDFEDKFQCRESGSG